MGSAMGKYISKGGESDKIKLSSSQLAIVSRTYFGIRFLDNYEHYFLFRENTGGLE